MKNCPKCGLANDVMRKYCRRCGASLIQIEEETTPEPAGIPKEEPIALTPSVSDDEPLVRPTSQPIAYEERPLVRPSEVASEQVETQSMETKPNVMTEEPPVSTEPSAAPVAEDTSESVSMDDERGKEVVAEIVQRVRAAEARQKATMETGSAEPEIRPPPAEPEIEPPPPEPPAVEPIETEAPPVYTEPEPEAEKPVVVEEQAPEEEQIAVKTPAPTVASAATAVSKPSPKDEIASDDKVRSLEADINAFNLELQQLRSEFDTLRTHLDEEVERYHNVAETKRVRAESIQRDLDLAKKEYNDASKEHKNVDNRRKKELSEAEKRVHDVEKRLKKAEESKEKRIQDIEKEQRKREEG